MTDAAAQAQTELRESPQGVELVAQTAAARALATHCSGRTRIAFSTFRGWLDFMTNNAKALSGRSFEQDLRQCAEDLPNLGTEGFTALGVLADICNELRASEGTCKFIRRQQNLYITVRG